MRFTTLADYLLIPFIVGPYVLLGGLAWRSRSDQRTAGALLALTLLLALVSLFLIGVESADYRAALVAHPSEKLKVLYQRIALFLVPAFQWPVALLTGLAMLVQTYLPRARSRKSYEHHEDC